MPLSRALPLLVVALACSSRQRFEDVNGAEGLVEVLPRSAMVEVDGVLLGPGSRTLPVPDRRAVHRVTARAPGFETLEVRVPAALLAGGRVALVLRPEGFGVARRLELDEPTGLTAAAALLLRNGRTREGMQYAARAAELAPDLPAPHRLLGDAYLREGRKDRALDEYGAYLAHATPGAPDRAEVQARVGALRGDLTVPGEPR